MLEDISKVKLHPGFRAVYRRCDNQLDLFYKAQIFASWRSCYGWLPLFMTRQLLLIDEILLVEDCVDILNEFILIQHNAQLSYRNNHGKISTGVNCSRLT